MRDVGTLDTYYEANMDIRAISPALISSISNGPCALPFTPIRRQNLLSTTEDRRGPFIDTVPWGDASSPAATVKNSVIGRHVYVHAGAEVTDSIVFDYCDIGRRAKLRRCILEKNVQIPRSHGDRIRPGGG